MADGIEKIENLKLSFLYPNRGNTMAIHNKIESEFYGRGIQNLKFTISRDPDFPNWVFLNPSDEYTEKMFTLFASV